MKKAKVTLDVFVNTELAEKLKEYVYEENTLDLNLGLYYTISLTKRGEEDGIDIPVPCKAKVKAIKTSCNWNTIWRDNK